MIRAALLLAGSVTVLAAGSFAPPAEGPLAFRRDRVPLDVDTMGKLSVNLVTLASGIEGKTPAERRGAAQMLALAVALDPGNARARRTLEGFESENHQADTDAENLAKSRERIWQWIGWLESTEAGADGQALADCLKDVVSISDPRDARASELLAKGEKGKWSGWIPAGSAYEEVKAVVQAPVDTTSWKPAALLTNASLSVPLWHQINKDEPIRWALALAPLQMTARSIGEDENADQNKFSLVLGQPKSEGGVSPLTEPLLKLLAAQHGKLPAGRTVTINSAGYETSQLSGKLQSISGAAAVLASAAITGIEPDATIIGTLDAAGMFKLPTNFWEQLRTVKDGNGGRLVLPAEAATYLPSILAMGNPKFFMDHEVVLAADFKQLLNLSAKTPGEDFEKISIQFEEIHEKMGNQPLGQYVANSFIRRRLTEIAQAAPFHYSAKMLAIQGAGNRPIYVIQPVVISELRQAIEPLEWVVRHGYKEFEPAELNAVSATLEKCTSDIEQLLRYTEKVDREVVDQVLAMAILLRPIERAARARPDPNDYGSNRELSNAITAFVKSHKEICSLLGLPRPPEPQTSNR